MWNQGEAMAMGKDDPQGKDEMTKDIDKIASQSGSSCGWVLYGFQRF